MTHHIQKQLLQLTLGPGVEAFGAQHGASRFNREVLIPLLERAFDELAGEEQVIRINRLVIDLGTLSVDQLTRPFGQQELYVLIREQLSQLMNAGNTDTMPEHVARRVSALDQWWYYMERGRLPWSADKVDDSWYRLVLESLSVDYDAVSRLRQALEDKVVFRQRLSRQHPDAFLETLAGILTGSRQESLGRLVEETYRFVEWLERRCEVRVEVTGNNSLDRIPEASLRRWRFEHSDLLARQAAGRKPALWELVLREVARHHEVVKAEGLVRFLHRWLSEDEQIHILLKEEKMQGSSLWAREDERSFGLSGDRRARTAGEAAFGANSTTVIDKPEDSSGSSPTLDAPAGGPPEPVSAFGKRVEQPPAHEAGESGVTRESINAEDPGARDRTAPPETPPMREPATLAMAGEAVLTESLSTDSVPHDGGAATVERLFDSREVDEEGLFGALAGLILLHPFFSALFDRCGLCEKGRFVDEQARHRAVFLLYYLGTGAKEGPEYELLFPKLFCGCDPEESLPAKMGLAESFYAEADDLLAMVLQRWEKLQHSSATALREGFLRRVGKLVNRNGRLVLLMETSAIDVLLDYLPWNLSIIKLPWWKELLYVEWR